MAMSVSMSIACVVLGVVGHPLVGHLGHVPGVVVRVVLHVLGPPVRQHHAVRALHIARPVRPLPGVEVGAVVSVLDPVLVGVGVGHLLVVGRRGVVHWLSVHHGGVVASMATVAPKPSTKASTKASTNSSTKSYTRSSTKPSTKPSTKSSTKPSTMSMTTMTVVRSRLSSQEEGREGKEELKIDSLDWGRCWTHAVVDDSCTFMMCGGCTCDCGVRASPYIAGSRPGTRGLNALSGRNQGCSRLLGGGGP